MVGVSLTTRAVRAADLIGNSFYTQCTTRRWAVHMVIRKPIQKRVSGQTQSAFGRQTKLEAAKLKRDNSKREFEEAEASRLAPTLADIDVLRQRLEEEGWTEKTHLGREPPPVLETDLYNGAPNAASRTALAKYYTYQLYLWNVKQDQRYKAFARRRAAQRHARRELRRQHQRLQPARETLRLSRDRPTENLLTAALNKFRSSVYRHPASNIQRHDGWPPRSAIHIGRLPTYNRELFVFNQRSLDGRKYTPVLAICVKNQPVLFLRPSELKRLNKLLPTFEQQAKTLRNVVGA